VLEKHCVLLDLCCNVNKTVCMVFNPKDKSKVVCNNFPCFTVDGKPMQFVTEFNLLSGNPERYSGRLLCTKNGNPD